MKSQFNETFSKIDGLKQWFKEQQIVTTLKGGSETPPHFHHEQGYSYSKTPSIHETPPKIQWTPSQEEEKPPTPQPSPQQTLLQQDPYQSPHQTHPQFRNLEPTLSSDHTNDSPATLRRKRDWRAAKFAEEIWRAHSLVQPWMSL